MLVSAVHDHRNFRSVKISVWYNIKSLLRQPLRSSNNSVAYFRSIKFVPFKENCCGISAGTNDIVMGLAVITNTDRIGSLYTYRLQFNLV